MKTKTIIIVILAILVLFIGGVYIFTVLLKSASIPKEEEALNIVLKEYPNLAKYQTTDLPPSSIESKQTPDGWYFGFIQSGSGLPGILNAQCYFLNNNKNITLVGEYKKDITEKVESIVLETCKPVVEIPTENPIVSPLPSKSVGIGIGEMKTFSSISIRPLSVEEDSRCPSDVVCIQAGTVRLKIDVISKKGTNTSIVRLGQEFTTENVKITLTNVYPASNSKINLTSSDYRFDFTVTAQSEPTVTQGGKCFIGGCSSQICSDQEGMASTCEYREEYSCYKTATCRRQTNGNCGWTETAELNACLLKN